MKLESFKVIPDHILKLMSPQDRPKGTAGMLKEEVTAWSVAKSERLIQAEIKDYLRLRGVRQVLCPHPSKKTTFQPGWPDFTLCFKGLPMFFEVKKAKGGVISEAQSEVTSGMREDGWHGGFVHSVEEVKQYLDAAELFLKK